MLHRPVEPEREAPQRQPISDIPWPVAATLALLLAIHAGRQLIPDAWDDALFLHLAFVPGRLTYAFAPDRVVDAVVALASQGSAAARQAQAERWLLVETGFDPWTTATYGLLHADWAHVGLNGVWLLAFGTPVARRFGPWRFFAFLVASAWAGAVVQWASHPLDVAPVIGASAAVSGCMGATLRFMFRSRAGREADAEPADGARRRASEAARPLRAVLTDGRAMAFLVAWFATNLLFGVGPASLGLGGGPIAWEAHIGGFATGFLLFRLFDPAPRLAPPDSPGP